MFISIKTETETEKQSGGSSFVFALSNNITFSPSQTGPTIPLND
jgi:hypothetical protein